MRALRDDLGIRTIVNFNNRTNKSEAKLAARMGLAYLPLRDNPFKEAGDRERYLAFLKTVREQCRNAPVYVHCATGSDRAGLAVAVYRVVECGWDASRALAELRRHQPYYMAVFFHRYPTILRDVERDRDNWLRQLDAMGDPPVQRPEDYRSRREAGQSCPVATLLPAGGDGTTGAPGAEGAFAPPAATTCAPARNGARNAGRQRLLSQAYYYPSRGGETLASDSGRYTRRAGLT